MGTPVGRIEKEFVFKALADEGTPCDLHGSLCEARCRLVEAVRIVRVSRRWRATSRDSSRATRCASSFI